MSTNDTPALDLVNGVARVIWWCLHAIKRLFYLGAFINAAVVLYLWYRSGSLPPGGIGPILLAVFILWFIWRGMRKRNDAS